MDTYRRDSGSIVLGWLTKLVVVIAAFGVAAFDGLSLGAAHVSASDDANQAAEVARTEWAVTHNVQAAYDAALSSITNASEEIPPESFSIDSDGTVHLMLHRTATTFVMQHIGPLEKYTTFSTTGEATPPTL